MKTIHRIINPKEFRIGQIEIDYENKNCKYVICISNIHFKLSDSYSKALAHLKTLLPDNHTKIELERVNYGTKISYLAQSEAEISFIFDKLRGSTDYQGKIPDQCCTDIDSLNQLIDGEMLSEPSRLGIK